MSESHSHKTHVLLVFLLYRSNKFDKYVVTIIYRKSGSYYSLIISIFISIEKEMDKRTEKYNISIRQALLYYGTYKC